jgi:hypothetical protein
LGDPGKANALQSYQLNKWTYSIHSISSLKKNATTVETPHRSQNILPNIFDRGLSTFMNLMQILAAINTSQSNLSTVPLNS